MLISMVDNVIIFAFAAFMLWIGYYFSKKVKDIEGFYLAGRSLPWSLTVGTLVATWYGASGTIATVEYAFVYGVSIWFAWCFTAHLSRIPMALWVGPKVHMSTGVTVPDLLKKLYGGVIAFFGAILMFFFCSQFYEVTALGIIGQTVWGIESTSISAIIVIISVLLTVLGGLMSVAVTDMILFFFMCFGLTMVLPIAWHDMGGLSAIVSALRGMSGAGFADSGGVEGFLSTTGGVSLPKAISLVILALGAYADPTFYQRFTASESKSSARRALLSAMIIWITFDFVLVMLGVLTKVAYPDMNPGAGYITLTLNYLPVGLKAMFIIGLLGSIISTLDSYYLTGGTTLANDIVAPLMERAGKPVTEKFLISVSRIGVVIMGLIGIGLATMFTMVVDAYIMLGGLWTATALVAIVGGLFWPFKRTVWGGAGAMASGFCVIIYDVAVAQTGEALFYALPISIAFFLIGNMFGPDLRKKGAVI